MSGFFDRLSAMLSGTAGSTRAGSEPTDLGGAPDAIRADDPRVPSGSRAKVARLLELAAGIEARGDRDSLAAAAVGEAKQTRDKHLPLLVSSYAAIPASHRTQVFRETGRSASYELNESIDRMIARLEAIVGEMAREGVAGFDDARRFIDQRYGGTGPSSS